MPLDDFLILNEEIAAMARAGLPIDKGLATLADEIGSGRLGRVTARIAEDLREGRTLPEALRRQGSTMPDYYAALMAAGMRSGRLGEILATLSLYTRTLLDLRAIVLSALFYPTLVFVISVGLLAVLLFFVVPQFERIFMDFRMKLPWVTQLVIDLSRYPFQVFVLPPLILLVLVLLTRWFLRRTAYGRQMWGTIIYRIPLFGTLIRAARLAAFTDLLGVLVDHDVPLHEAFRLAGEASADPLVSAGARQVGQHLGEGEPLGRALSQATMVPQFVAWMIGLGERRGTLAATLHQVSQMYRRQVELRAGLLKSALSPFFIVIVATVIVGLFVLALFMPLLGLLEGLGGGFKK